MSTIGEPDRRVRRIAQLLLVAIAAAIVIVALSWLIEINWSTRVLASPNDAIPLIQESIARFEREKHVSISGDAVPILLRGSAKYFAEHENRVTVDRVQFENKVYSILDAVLRAKTQATHGTPRALDQADLEYWIPKLLCVYLWFCRSSED
jgi:hypothetical protein